MFFCLFFLIHRITNAIENVAHSSSIIQIFYSYSVRSASLREGLHRQDYTEYTYLAGMVTSDHELHVSKSLLYIHWITLQYTFCFQLLIWNVNFTHAYWALVMCQSYTKIIIIKKDNMYPTPSWNSVYWKEGNINRYLESREGSANGDIYNTTWQ